jgi:hypothetical protein
MDGESDHNIFQMDKQKDPTIFFFLIWEVQKEEKCNTLYLLVWRIDRQICWKEWVWQWQMQSRVNRSSFPLLKIYSWKLKMCRNILLLSTNGQRVSPSQDHPVSSPRNNKFHTTAPHLSFCHHIPLMLKESYRGMYFQMNRTIAGIINWKNRAIHST